MILTVYRGDGLREGAPIIEPLLSDPVLIERGRAEMDAHAHASVRVDLEVVFRPGLRLGQLIEVADPTTASPYRARVIGIALTISTTQIESQLTLERAR